MFYDTKFLRDIGVESMCNDSTFSLEQLERFKIQRAYYGLDERNTWDLRYATAEWIYNNLNMYKLVASNIVDLEFYAFDLAGIKFTQSELIDKTLQYLELFFIAESKYNDYMSHICIHLALYLYNIIIEHLWW